MAKKKQPAPKRGGQKKAVLKKAVKSKPITQQAAEQSAQERALHKAHAIGKSEASALPHVDVSEPAKPGLLRRALHHAKRLFRFRSAKTGKFVTWAEDQANPDTTIRERVD